MIDKYDTSNFLDLIEKAKDGFAECLSLENQGRKPLKDALRSCYKITKYIKEQDLKELLIDKNLIKEESFDIKNKAKYVLWLTMGKPDKSKKTDDEIRYKRDTARLRMYKRVLEKFILKDLSEDEACQFLETYVCQFCGKKTTTLHGGICRFSPYKNKTHKFIKAGINLS